MDASHHKGLLQDAVAKLLHVFIAPTRCGILERRLSADIKLEGCHNLPSTEISCRKNPTCRAAYSSPRQGLRAGHAKLDGHVGYPKRIPS